MRFMIGFINTTGVISLELFSIVQKTVQSLTKKIYVYFLDELQDEVNTYCDFVKVDGNTYIKMY